MWMEAQQQKHIAPCTAQKTNSTSIAPRPGEGSLEGSKQLVPLMAFKVQLTAVVALTDIDIYVPPGERATAVAALAGAMAVPPLGLALLLRVQ